MIQSIRILEKRVAQAVDRLRELNEEKTQLGAELDSLRLQLESRGAGDDGTDFAWREQRDQAMNIVRQALAELRAD